MARPFLSKYGSKTQPATPKRIAVMSKGVRLVLIPNRTANIQAVHMLTAAMAESEPRTYSEVVGLDNRWSSVSHGLPLYSIVYFVKSTTKLCLSVLPATAYPC